MPDSIAINNEIPLCDCECGKTCNDINANGEWSKYRKGHKQYPVPKDSPPFCICGCGLGVIWNDAKHRWNKYIFGHPKSLKQQYIETPPLCACGCGKSVNWDIHNKRWHGYIKNHHISNPDRLLKASISLKERYKDPEYKEKPGNQY